MDWNVKLAVAGRIFLRNIPALVVYTPIVIIIGTSVINHNGVVNDDIAAVINNNGVVIMNIAAINDNMGIANNNTGDVDDDLAFVNDDTGIVETGSGCW